MVKLGKVIVNQKKYISCIVDELPSDLQLIEIDGAYACMATLSTHTLEDPTCQ